MQVEKPKVVFVMGTGRSGSTILGIALGNCADVFYAGELNWWWGTKGKPSFPGAERARFWSAVREEVTPELSGPQARSLEQSSALLRVGDWRAQRRLHAPFRRVSEDLYRAIARVAATTYVVDSSHFPRRAWEMQKLDGIELYLLFLVRKPKNIVASYSEDDVVFPQFNAINTNGYLWLTYLLSLFVFLRQPRDRRLLVSYEAFASDPEGVLTDILDWIGCSAAIPDLSALNTGVAYRGSAELLKNRDVVAFESRPPRRSRGSRLVALLNFPWTVVFSLLRPSRT